MQVVNVRCYLDNRKASTVSEQTVNKKEEKQLRQRLEEACGRAACGVCPPSGQHIQQHMAKRRVEFVLHQDDKSSNIQARAECSQTSRDMRMCLCAFVGVCNHLAVSHYGSPHFSSSSQQGDEHILYTGYDRNYTSPACIQHNYNQTTSNIVTVNGLYSNRITLDCWTLLVSDNIM